MKFVIVFVALLAVAFAAPADVEILSQEFDNIGTDGFKFSYANSDGQSQEAVAVVKNLDSDDAAISITGQYSYIGDDGVTYTVNYIADENGFQPQGDHIPKN